jgi:hypothetical protein
MKSLLPSLAILSPWDGNRSKDALRARRALTRPLQSLARSSR